MLEEGSETCVPVSGKPKRPAVRPSVDCPTYGQEMGGRQGRGVTGVPLGQKQRRGPEFVMPPLCLKAGIVGRADRIDGGLEAYRRRVSPTSQHGSTSERFDVVGDGDLPQQHAAY